MTADAIGAVLVASSSNTRKKKSRFSSGFPKNFLQGAASYSGGGHGFGIRPQGTTCDHWIDDYHAWLGLACDSGFILANFGTSDAAILVVITGDTKARGLLSYLLLRSMSAVEVQDPALPDDSADPKYAFGFGILLD